MASNINRTQYADAIKTLYEQQLLERALPRLVHGRWAQTATLNGYGSYELRRYESLSAVTTSLTEGVTPDEQDAPSLTTLTITPAWYGAWMQYTQQLEQVAYDPILAEMSEILGEQAGLSADTLIRNHITGDATTRYSGAATARDGLDTTNDMIGYVDILKAVAVLEAENTRPADGGFFPVVIHPHTWAKLMRDATFLALFQQETSNSPLRTGMIGTLLNCKLYISSNSRIYTDAGASSAEVYVAMFIGLRSYGVVGMAGLIPSMNLDAGGPDMSWGGNTGKSIMPVSIIKKGLGETGFDPLEQRGTLGWKMAHEEDVLKTEWIIALEHVNDFS